MKVIHIVAFVTLGFMACLALFIKCVESGGTLFSIEFEWLQLQQLEGEVDTLMTTVDSLEAKVLELEQELQKLMASPSKTDDAKCELGMVDGVCTLQGDLLVHGDVHKTKHPQSASTQYI